MCASSNGLRASQVAVGQGQGHSPDTNEYGRAIWTVNAVNHDGVTFRRFGRPNFTRSARECCSTARAYSKRRWLKSEISVAIKMVLTGFGRRVCAWLDRTLTPDSTCSGVLRGVAEDLMKCLDILIQSGVAQAREIEERIVGIPSQIGVACRQKPSPRNISTGCSTST